MQSKLLVLRLENNKTQKDLAKFLNISKETYRRKEKGQSDFTASEMFKLAKFFNKKIDDIFLP